MPYGRILIIEEDAQLKKLMCNYLESKGMEVFLRSRVDDYTLGMSSRASVILLSATVAGDDVGSCIERLRGGSNVPLIVLTSYCSEEGSMLYFRLGADQVIEKPFNIAEVSLRIKALLRRCGDTNYYQDTSAAFGGLTVDLREYSAMIDGQSVELTPKEIELLFLLVSHPEQTFSRGELSSRIWGRILADNRTIAVHINRIKNKIGSYGKNITAVRGVGYKFTERVSE